MSRQTVGGFTAITNVDSVKPDSTGQRQSVFMTVSRMKSECGWTDGLIRKLLGEPDRLEPNPHYARGPQMRLYEKMRVARAEDTHDFRRVLSGRDRRRRIAARTTRRRRVDYVRWAWSLDLRCRFPERLEDVYRLGHRHRIEWTELGNGRRHAGGAVFDDGPLENPWQVPPSYNMVPQADLDRWAVNYLRHVCTMYDDIMVHVTGSTSQFHRSPKPGISRDDMDAAHAIIKDRVLHEIIRAFPELTREAESQMLASQDGEITAGPCMAVSPGSAPP